MSSRQCASLMAATRFVEPTADGRSAQIRSTAPLTRRSATTRNTPARVSRATWRYRLPAGTSSSSAASSLVVSVRSPSNAFTIRNRAVRE